MSWYTLKGDSTAAPFEYLEQQDNEVEVLWMPFKDVAEKLSYEGEKILANRVFEALEKLRLKAIEKIRLPSEADIKKIVQQALKKEKTDGTPVGDALKGGVDKAASEREFRDFLQSLEEVGDY